MANAWVGTCRSPLGRSFSGSSGWPTRWLDGTDKRVGWLWEEVEQVLAEPDARVVGEEEDAIDAVNSGFWPHAIALVARAAIVLLGIKETAGWQCWVEQWDVSFIGGEPKRACMVRVDLTAIADRTHHGGEHLGDRVNQSLAEDTVDWVVVVVEALANLPGVGVIELGVKSEDHLQTGVGGTGTSETLSGPSNTM